MTTSDLLFISNEWKLANPSSQSLNHHYVYETIARAVLAEGYTINDSTFWLSKYQSQYFGRIELAGYPFWNATPTIGFCTSVNKTWPKTVWFGLKFPRATFWMDQLGQRKQTSLGKSRFEETAAESAKKIAWEIQNAYGIFGKPDDIGERWNVKNQIDSKQFSYWLICLFYERIINHVTLRDIIDLRNQDLRQTKLTFCESFAESLMLVEREHPRKYATLSTKASRCIFDF